MLFASKLEKSRWRWRRLLIGLSPQSSWTLIARQNHHLNTSTAPWNGFPWMNSSLPLEARCQRRAYFPLSSLSIAVFVFPRPNLAAISNSASTNNTRSQIRYYPVVYGDYLPASAFLFPDAWVASRRWSVVVWLRATSSISIKHHFHQCLFIKKNAMCMHGKLPNIVILCFILHGRILSYNDNMPIIVLERKIWSDRNSNFPGRHCTSPTFSTGRCSVNMITDLSQPWKILHYRQKTTTYCYKLSTSAAVSQFSFRFLPQEDMRAGQMRDCSTYLAPDGDIEACLHGGIHNKITYGKAAQKAGRRKGCRFLSRWGWNFKGQWLLLLRDQWPIAEWSVACIALNLAV